MKQAYNKSMKTLTAKQERFAQNLAKGMTQADAYRAAYPGSKKWADSSVWSKASVMSKNVKVAARVRELKDKLAQKALWTREMSVKALAKVYQMAEQDRNASAMTGAVKELNAMHGYNEPAKVDVTTAGESLNAIDRAAALAAVTSGKADG